MRINAALLALPALASAQQQVPLMDQLKGWFDKATQAVQGVKSSASSALPSASSIPNIPNPINAGAAKVAALSVERMTLENHLDLLKTGAATASPGIEEFMLFITGGNKTCFGLCGHAETEWNKSVPLIAASPNAPKLAVLSCETDPVLCNAWGAGPPSIFYMLLPQPLPDQSTPATTVHEISLNRTVVTAAEIAALATQGKYKETAPYEGWFHPFDGQLAKLGAAIPLGYAVYYISLVPSWMLMVGISFFTRNFM
ncbi:hypothetical protein MBLNU459_g8056t2 [Dothideomycetes sp. NU459]